MDPDGIAVVGGSKGGELALLLAAAYPEDLKAVVAHVPSGVVFQGISRSFREPASSWTLGGEPVPFVSFPFDVDTIRMLLGMAVGRPVALRSSYEHALSDVAAVEAATIPVEKIRGPVLLISGTDDQVWPSDRLAEIAVARLKANDHPFSVQHLRYDGAGHSINVPYLPGTGAPQVGSVAFGGTISKTALASADSWPKVLAFLAEHL